MRKLILIIIGLALAICANAFAYVDGDFQIWNTDVEEFKVCKNTKVALEQEFRWADNAREFFYQHYDIGLFYNVNKYLNIGGGYRHVLSLRNGEFKTGNEPYMTATLFWDLMGFKFDDRSRVEYRHFAYQQDRWRYRNKITMKFPWKFTKLEIQPYLSDEILINLGSIAQLNENRGYAGVGMGITKNIKTEIYYMLQNTKGTDTWTKSNVLGTKIKIVF